MNITIPESHFHINGKPENCKRKLFFRISIRSKRKLNELKSPINTKIRKIIRPNCFPSFYFEKK